MTPIELVTGDEIQLEFILRDSNTAAPGRTLNPADETTWARIDLTGKTVSLFWRLAGSDDTPVTVAGAVQVPAVQGLVFSDTPATLLATEGRYEFEIQTTTTATGKTQTVAPKFLADVRGEVG